MPPISEDLPSIATLAHDLGQPLFAIRLSAELLMLDSGPMDSELAQKKIAAIFKASEESMAILEKILL